MQPRLFLILFNSRQILAVTNFYQPYKADLERVGGDAGRETLGWELGCTLKAKKIHPFGLFVAFVIKTPDFENAV